MTRLFNDPATFSEDMLAGFLDANSRYVTGVPGGVVRATETPPGKVAVVIGGGSGHYPAFCGVVGPGFADGAVVGNIFTSPSAHEAASVARAAHGDAGVLLLTGNYAGDVMNFGLAVNNCATRASTRASSPSLTTSPAHRQKKLPSAAASPVTSPYSGALARPPKTVPTSTASNGSPPAPTNDPHPRRRVRRLHAARRRPAAVHRARGQHGPRPGHPRRARRVRVEPMPTADELAPAARSGVLDERACRHVEPDCGHPQRPWPHQVRGTVRGLDDRRRLLTEAGYVVVDPEVGELVTSLDMAGCSLTVIWLDDELERLWTAPADTPAYRKGRPPPQRPAARTDADADRPWPPRRGRAPTTTARAGGSLVAGHFRRSARR